MKLVEYSIRNYHTVVVAVVFLAVLGVLSFQSLPRQLIPTVDKPLIQVKTKYLGLSPSEVEQNITRRLEDQLESVEGLKRMVSKSSHGSSDIELEFDWGTDKKIAMIDVNNKLQQVKDLPPVADKPTLKSVSTDNSSPIMWMVFQKPHPKSPDLDQNYMFQVGEDLALPALLRVDGVAEVWHFGGEEREMRVEFDPYSMARLHVTYKEAIESLRDENQNVRAGFHDEADRNYTVRTLGEFKSQEDILNAVVKRDGRKTIFVRDFARVVDGFKRRESIVKISGQVSNAFGIIRKSGANVVDTCREVGKVAERLNREFVNRGIPLQIKIVYQDVDYIFEAMSLVKSNLGLGALLAVAVLLVFLGSVRSVLIVGISIPLSLVSVFIILKLLGRSINIISLAGMAFAVGMVVDNSIVVLENIYRHLAMKKGAVRAAFDGTTEVWGAVFASTLTTLAVFLPVVFIQEEAGQLFRDIAITISSSIALSLLVSLTVIPTLTPLIIRLKPGEEYTSGELHRTILKPLALLGTRIAQAYSDVMRFLLGRGVKQIFWKSGIVGLALATLYWSFLLLPPSDYLPFGNSNMVFMLMEPVAGNPVEKNIEYFAPYEKEIVKMKDVDRNFLVFSDRFNGGGLLIDPELARGQEGEVKMALKSREVGSNLFKIPGYRFAFAAQRPIFRSADKTFKVEILGPDMLKLKSLAQKMIPRISTHPGIHSVRPEFKFGNPELRFVPKREQNARLNLGVPEIGDIVEALNAGKYLGEYNDRGDPIDFVLVRDKNTPLALDDYLSLPIWTAENKMTYLGHLTNVSVDAGPARIDHIEKERSITLLVQVKKDQPMQPAIDKVETEELSPLRATLSEEYGLQVGGLADDLGSTQKALLGSFVYAVAFIYFLMVALFKSFMRPLIVMLTVVFATSGAFLGIVGNNELQRIFIEGILEDWNVPNAAQMAAGWNWITFDILTQLGIIILAGIVVNNAILIVHQTLNNIKEGMEEHEALLHSCETRLRPIMMTAISSIFGMVPLAFGEGAGTELYRGMGAAIIGGLSLSSLITLFLVPVLMSFTMDLGLHIRKEDIEKDALSTAPSN